MDNLKPHLGSWLDHSNQLTRGLVGYWPFTKAGKLKDFSLYNNDGDITGATWQGAGLSFDGSSDLVQTPLNVSGWQEMSFACCLKTRTTLGGYVGDCSDGPEGFGLRISGTKWDFFCYDQGSPGVVSSGVIDADRWYFVVGIHQPGENSLYVDGVQVDSAATGSFGIDATDEDVVIGAEFDGASSFNGIIKYTTMYNRALSATEIKSLYINPNQLIYNFDPWLYQQAAVGGIGRLVNGGLIDTSLLNRSLVA